MIDKDIYVDVNGTLFRELCVPDGKPEGMRDNMVGFLKFLVDNFKNVYWLTTNHKFANTYLKSIGEYELDSKIKDRKFTRNKCEAIDYSRPFYYFDDRIDLEYYMRAKGLSKKAIPNWKKQPFYSKYNPQIHVMYYVPPDAPMSFLNTIIDDLKAREGIE